MDEAFLTTSQFDLQKLLAMIDLQINISLSHISCHIILHVIKCQRQMAFRRNITVNNSLIADTFGQGR